ncbi:hypothetical protein WKH50_03435 [Pantoea agglomerans]|uniref:hypothetical protein n=1 Tax=Enterobacter agglomerans TaxID=549 RepID=UPI003C7984BA
MTIVMTILASDNARNRRRAKRAAEREQVAGQQHISRIEKAVISPSLREKREEVALRISTKYQKVSNEAGRQIHAVQKIRGKSIPLI